MQNLNCPSSSQCKICQARKTNFRFVFLFKKNNWTTTWTHTESTKSTAPSQVSQLASLANTSCICSSYATNLNSPASSFELPQFWDRFQKKKKKKILSGVYLSLSQFLYYLAASFAFNYANNAKVWVGKLAQVIGNCVHLDLKREKPTGLWICCYIHLVKFVGCIESLFVCQTKFECLFVAQI